MGEKYYSWEIINSMVAIKRTDKSVFDYSQTGIPIKMRSFWNVQNLDRGQILVVRLFYKGKAYNAHIQMENSPRLRTKLLWPKELTQKMHSEDGFPLMRFEKRGNNAYYVDFIYETQWEESQLGSEDIWYEVSIDNTMGLEGKMVVFFTSKYERNAKNRREAIKIHGLRCKVCGFDFQEMYGDLGKDFIEIHHIKPLASLEGESVMINPETDLRPVCSNCHRMIHRRTGKVYSIEELKAIVKENTNEE